MNEPACFNNNEGTMPKTNLHTLPDGNIVEHRLVHSIYGFSCTKSTSEGLKARSNDEDRLFLLSRSYFAGSQQHSTAVWTADCRCDWDHFNITVKQLLQTSICGIPMVGSDIPGFYGNPKDEEIVVRWYQMGCMMPLFRAHAHRKTERREPWVFSPETRERIRDSIILRYEFI